MDRAALDSLALDRLLKVAKKLGVVLSVAADDDLSSLQVAKNIQLHLGLREDPATMACVAGSSRCGPPLQMAPDRVTAAVTGPTGEVHAPEDRILGLDLGKALAMPVLMQVTLERLREDREASISNLARRKAANERLRGTQPPREPWEKMHLTSLSHRPEQTPIGSCRLRQGKASRPTGHRNPSWRTSHSQVARFGTTETPKRLTVHWERDTTLWRALIRLFLRLCGTRFVLTDRRQEPAHGGLFFIVECESI
ncbi:unnamed protein product [Lampetra planeri]